MLLGCVLCGKMYFITNIFINNTSAQTIHSIIDIFNNEISIKCPSDLWLLYYTFGFRVPWRKYLRCLRTYETPVRVPHPPGADINLETFTHLGPLSYIPEFDNVYQEIPEIDETFCRIQPSQSDSSSSSNDVS